MWLIITPYESHSIVKSIIYKGVSIHFLSIFALKWSQIEEWKYEKKI